MKNLSHITLALALFAAFSLNATEQSADQAPEPTPETTQPSNPIEFNQETGHYAPASYSTQPTPTTPGVKARITSAFANAKAKGRACVVNATAKLGSVKNTGVAYAGKAHATVARDLHLLRHDPFGFAEKNKIKTAAYVAALAIALAATGKGVHSICKAVKAKLTAKNS